MIGFWGKVVENVTNEAVLSNDKVFTSFMFDGHNIRFRTSPRLERYTKVVEWDNGYDISLLWQNTKDAMRKKNILI